MTKPKAVKMASLNETLANFRIRSPHWNNGKWYKVRVYPSTARRWSYQGYEVEGIEEKGPLRNKKDKKGEQLTLI